MNAFLIVVFILLLLLTVHSLIASSLLSDLEINDPDAHAGLDLNRENFWNHTQPLRISFGYVIPGAYKQWTLSDKGRTTAVLLRVVSIGVVLASLAVIGLVVAENV